MINHPFAGFIIFNSINGCFLLGSLIFSKEFMLNFGLKNSNQENKQQMDPITIACHLFAFRKISDNAFNKNSEVKDYSWFKSSTNNLYFYEIKQSSLAICLFNNTLNDRVAKFFTKHILTKFINLFNSEFISSGQYKSFYPHLKIICEEGIFKIIKKFAAESFSVGIAIKWVYIFNLPVKNENESNVESSNQNNQKKK